MLGADGHITLTDFGLSKDFSNVGGFNDEDNRALTICGTQGSSECDASCLLIPVIALTDLHTQSTWRLKCCRGKDMDGRRTIGAWVALRTKC